MKILKYTLLTALLATAALAETSFTVIPTPLLGSYPSPSSAMPGWRGGGSP